MKVKLVLKEQLNDLIEEPYMTSIISADHAPTIGANIEVPIKTGEDELRVFRVTKKHYELVDDVLRLVVIAVGKFRSK